ncbi:hypothetical protein E8E12_002178 [Didymella heteroderae]|uniref:Uncharacterized protein n=1 Tax=Didymella heteroderae TaxID=1769908 RepID=A0A9P4WGI4_9PLEO|nr:hypothetical protein E8E12_002178 [Didymella heteroderae]
MSFIRSTALRASSVARAARPAVRAAQPLRQNIQRRTYASGHGHSEAKSSDVPWMAAAVAGTVGGLYVVFSQDFGHGGHDDHDEHVEKANNKELQEKANEEAPALQKEKFNSKQTAKQEAEENDATDVNAPKIEKKDANEEDMSKDADEKNDGGPTDYSKHSESPEKAAEDKKKEHKEAKASSSQEKTDDEAEASPDKSDKPSPRKEPKSFNEMSGKQQGMSNDDTHHSSQISEQDEKSKKGEGVAETAKLKGTVSTDRPPAENKEERGKAQMDKDA